MCIGNICLKNRKQTEDVFVYFTPIFCIKIVRVENKRQLCFIFIKILIIA